MIEDPNFDWSMLSPQKAKQLEAMYETTGLAIAHKMIFESMRENVRAAELLLRNITYEK